jgi:pullulanase-type alpha-1,6-glucosidase
MKSVVSPYSPFILFGFVSILVFLFLQFAGMTAASNTPRPAFVTVAGNLQSELGCAEDWNPGCDLTRLNFNEEDRAWQRVFAVPAGSYEYKGALNNSWDENYGANATRDGSNIKFSLDRETDVKFYYDHDTHWIADNVTQKIAIAPGSFQSELGCGGDWDPSCLRSWLKDPDGDGVYTFQTASLPAGTYETKVALNESWNENYGQGGVRDGANISFTVGGDCNLTVFSFDSEKNVLTVSAGVEPPKLPKPRSVTIAGSLQSELNCDKDWNESCSATHLDFDDNDGVWQKVFQVPAGNFEYKAALNDSWDENYGANASPNGSNIGLNLAEPRGVKFYFDRQTNWVTDNVNKTIAIAPGSFQSELGCSSDWDPSCLRSWLKDPDGDNIYSFSTRSLPAGNYETKVALNESWEENYGQNGERNGANISFTVPNSCAEVFFQYNASTRVLTVSASGAPKGDLSKAKAVWVSRDTIAWNAESAAADSSATLHYAANGGLAVTPDGVIGGETISLARQANGLSDEIKAKFPHLSSYAAYKVSTNDLEKVPEILKSQIVVSAADAQDRPLDATSVQIQGALDDLYTFDGKLGVNFNRGAPTLRLWAPTARSVNLRLFADSNPATTAQIVPMTVDAKGVWSVAGSADWKNKFYLYEVEVFVRSTGKVERNLVTDPYSHSLSRNSLRSQIVDLEDAALKPVGWNQLRKPFVNAPEDISIYELHVRDFSASDETVPANERGTFKAFTRLSNGMRHLSALSGSGLTHVHLLPAFDIASVNEDKSQWQQPAGDLSSFAPNSEEQQARVGAVANQDGYNWGYDPYHYTVPEGSYATDADGSRRIVEFREMVGALASNNLQVVMDVVYNHTSSSGQNEKSVLDRVVPGYYHRLNAQGDIERSTCCENTATENNMMEKLMIDSVVTWAREYKVDGFRFDLMAHHMKRNIVKLRAELDKLTLERDGVDGKKIYLYGEGWNFGEVANNARGVNATQINMFGTGVGTFTDRLRDTVRGGGPFSGIQEQGFINGLYTDPNATNQGSSQDQRERLLFHTDVMKIGMAGNLASYKFTDRLGNEVEGGQFQFNGQPVGYTADPQEVVNYIEAHDNDTLFDAIHLKAANSASLDDRVRMQNLGISIVTLSQGVPFIHAGAELLRSKSLDRNSYNSGDWFNKLDFTYNSNNWGVGLPPAGDNKDNWQLFGSLLANPALKPNREQILDAFAHLRETLAIRRSTPLFRLRTAEQINQNVRFYNNGANQIPDLIVKSVADKTGEVDRRRKQVVVLINSDKKALEFQDAAFAGQRLALHPILAASEDATVRTSSFNQTTGAFIIPARTTVVFWAARPINDQINLLVSDVNNLVSKGFLNSGQGNALVAKLNAALSQLEKGNGTASKNTFNAFMQQVKALQSSGKLSPEQSAALMFEAGEISNQIVS